MQYGKIDKDKLILTKDTTIYNVKVEEKPVGYKEVKFAKIPEFDQLTHAVYQATPKDMGDYIEAGIVVVKMKKQVEPLMDEFTISVK